MKLLTRVFEFGTDNILATYPDMLKLVKVGQDFYIGQVRHVVVAAWKVGEGLMHIYVRKA